MPDVWKPFNGSVSFVLLRHQTRWGLKCSTLAMGSSTLMVLTKRSGCVATNAKRLSICAVSLKRKKKISNSPSCAGLMSVGSQAGRSRPQAGSQAGNIFIHSGEAKDDQKEGQKGERQESNSSKKDCICRERQKRAAVEDGGPR